MPEYFTGRDTKMSVLSRTFILLTTLTRLLSALLREPVSSFRVSACMRHILIATAITLTGIPAIAGHDTTHQLVDPQATPETHNLYANLMPLAPEAVLFGHQATLEYGYTWHHSELPAGESRSDVKDVAGSFPALYGWDLNYFIQPRFDADEKQQRTDQMLLWTREGLERGGVVTFCWHKYNPSSGSRGSFYDTTNVAYRLLPGGDLHDSFRRDLDQAAGFFHALSPMPVIFRPWHEHNGDWFWWGKGIATEQEFIDLWRFTVEYLRDEKEVRNLLWAFSPDRSRMDIDNFHEDYHYGYPGDGYVDIIGLDNYWDLGHPVNETPPDEQRAHFVRSLQYTVEIANSKGKLAALTETGLEAIPEPDWWTEVMLESLLANDLTRQISWLKVWRNANYEREQWNHYYAPFPGQKSADDFVKFRDHPFVLFEDDLPDMYSPVQQ